MGGVVATSDIQRLKTLIIRATRGQTFFHDVELTLSNRDKIYNDDYHLNKRIFVVAYNEAPMIEEKLKKIFGSFSQCGEFFDHIPTEILRQEINEIILNKEEVRNMIINTKQALKSYLISADTLENV